ncbi:uncharacterized protein CC84DRAFT_1214169 [Paraphaeosphaeria sporulosa]|uniref:Uncharacterized protein n=1 Tax=Paraphaeosphaeria sporulosa TaxID=1460663 RepID=A0A177CVG6_9PLEO|nr:uncharacterized protein CC84DRAFT_1214169 [Paraphaeosphaeria sporulosa]OAG10882.1 hypothetical protein CC84DRAFT_1214169 [Paraphaeosphaeria sporulosa]
MRSLPTELWEQIFSHLECPMPIDNWWYYGSQYDVSSLKDLASLSLACRTFQHIAQKFMYRTILAEAFSQEDSKVRDENKRLLARSMVQNPRLAAHARNVCLDSLRNGEDVECESLLRRADVGEREKRWLKMAMMKETKIGWNGRLLALMRNLQVVDVAVYRDAFDIAGMLSGRSDVEKIVQTIADLRETMRFTYSRRLEEEQLLRAIPTPFTDETLSDNALPHLKELRIRHRDSESGSISIADIEAVLLHPGLERLYLLGFDWTSFSLRKTRWPLHPNPAIRILDLRECFIDATGLRDVLTRFRNLHTLHILFGDSRRDDPSFDTDREQFDLEVDLSAMGAVLREHGQSLVSFELHTTGYSSYSSTDGQVDSLKEMTSLRHLKIAECDFTGHRNRWENDGVLALEDALPAGLETLYLHYDDRWFGPCSPDRGLFVMLGRTLRSGRFSELKEIKVERYLNDSTKELEPEIEGWEVRMTEAHFRMGVSSSGCMRLLIELTPVDD